MNHQIKSLTQSNDNENLYKQYITDIPTENMNNNNNTVNYNSNEYTNISQPNNQNKKMPIKNKINSNNNNNANYSKILKMFDEEKKKSTELQSKINSLQFQISSKNQEIQTLNNKISLLIKKSEEINKVNNSLNENNNIFYQNFLSIIDSFKSSKNFGNIHLPNYSKDDEQVKKNKDILYTIEVLINLVIEMSQNTDNNIFQFNELKDKIELVNKKYNENKNEKNNKMLEMKKQIIKINNILDQNMDFLNEIRNENMILKQRNLNLEKNINLISKSNESFRKNNYLTMRLYNKNLSQNFNDKNNISSPSIKTNKTKNDLLIEEFYEKENKIESLHNLANKIFDDSKIINNNKEENKENLDEHTINILENKNEMKNNNFDKLL